MRVVLDTNVLVAAVLTRATCRQVVATVADQHIGVISQFIVDEFERALEKMGRRALPDAARIRILVSNQFEVLNPTDLPETVCRDPDDDRVLATAVTGQADYIVTGDADLLILDRYGEIEILSPRAFLDRQGESTA